MSSKRCATAERPAADQSVTSQSAAGVIEPPGRLQPPSSGQEMRRKLREGLNELPDAVHEMRATMNEFRVVLQSAKKNFKNLEGFTEPLGQKGTDITTRC